MSLVTELNNDSFGQELVTLDNDSFEIRKKIRNSTRGASKTLKNFDRRIKKHRKQIKKIISQKRAYSRKRG